MQFHPVHHLSAFPLEIQLVFLGFWLGVVGLLAVGLNRCFSLDSEVIRKVVHIGTGNVILLAWWMGIPAWLGIAVSVIFSILTLMSYRFPILGNINGVERRSLGTFFYAASIGILIAWFWSDYPQYAVLGVMVMTWGDGLAALVGQNFGRHPYHLWGISKSWEGSIAMAVVSYVISSLVLDGTQETLAQAVLIPVSVAIFAAMVEAFSKFGIDNLTVPLGSAVLAFGLHQMMV